MMIDNVLVEIPPIENTGAFTLNLNREIEINISANEAQRKVNRYIHLEISTQMHTEAPQLSIGATIAWLVPVHLTFPSYGDVGCVGRIDVDTKTGALNNNPNIIEEIKDNATELASRFTPMAMD